MALNLVRGVSLTPKEKETMLDILTPPPSLGPTRSWWRRWQGQWYLLLQLFLIFLTWLETLCSKFMVCKIWEAISWRVCFTRLDLVMTKKFDCCTILYCIRLWLCTLRILFELILLFKISDPYHVWNFSCWTWGLNISALLSEWTEWIIDIFIHFVKKKTWSLLLLSCMHVIHLHLPRPFLSTSITSDLSG